MGGGDTVQPTDPMREAQSQIAQLREQYRLEEEQAMRAMERERAEAEAGRARFETDVTGARQATRGGIDQMFAQRGLDPMEHDARIRSALDVAQAGIPYGGEARFSPDIGDNILGAIRNENIRGYQGSINQFAPEGFADQAFASTSDDAIIEAVLGEQFSESSDAIMRARDRGTLNDTGFTYANTNLENQRRAASARLQDIGGGILEGYRGQLGDIASNARTAAGGWDFGDTFDPNTFRTQLEGRQGELSGRLEGDIRNAIGGEQFFNTADLIQKGGVGQGVTNTGLGAQGGSLLAAMQERKKDEQKQRGLGTQGSF